MKRKNVSADLGPLSNRVLDVLPDDLRASWLSRVEQVPLQVPRILYHARETPAFGHFLLGGVASVATLLRDGNSISVGLLGPGDLVEAFHLLGDTSVRTEGLMQVEGLALRLPFAEIQREFLSCAALRNAVFAQVQEQGLVVNQLVACSRYHEVEAQLARWLLTIADRLRQSSFHLTQEFLAEMLGVRRPTVTLAAGRLHRKGLIAYSRGLIEISSRAGLEGAACECYEVIRTLHFRPPPRLAGNVTQLPGSTRRL